MQTGLRTLPVVFWTVGLLGLVGCCDFEISTKNVPSGAVGAPYSYTLDTKCGDADWRLISGQLPPGLGLDRKGRLSGTPGLAGSYTFTLEAASRSNPENDVISQGYALVITEAVAASNRAAISSSAQTTGFRTR